MINPHYRYNVALSMNSMPYSLLNSGVGSFTSLRCNGMCRGRTIILHGHPNQQMATNAYKWQQINILCCEIQKGKNPRFGEGVRFGPWISLGFFFGHLSIILSSCTPADRSNELSCNSVCCCFRCVVCWMCPCRVTLRPAHFSRR